MKLIKPSVENVVQMPNLIGLYQHIEKAARNCYRSENLINEDSYNRMMEILSKNGHYSPMEHGTVYLYITHTSPMADRNYMRAVDVARFYQNNKYSKVVRRSEDHFHVEYFITTNYRVIYENNHESDLEYLCEPTKYHERRYTFKVTTSISISREMNRNRGEYSTAISEQSTRYCNYSKDKFGNEITFCIPGWSNLEPGTYGEDSELIANNQVDMTLLDYLFASEYTYMLFLGSGYKAQDVREVLPLCTATTVFYTAFKSDWEKFITQRTSEAAHPDIRPIAHLIDDFIKEDEAVLSGI